MRHMLLLTILCACTTEPEDSGSTVTDDTGTWFSKLLAQKAREGVQVRVLVDEEPREVLAMIAGKPDSRTFLTPGDREQGCAYGWFDADAGAHTLRIVVTDEARNEVLVEQAVLVADDELDAVEGDEEWCL